MNAVQVDAAAVSGSGSSMQVKLPTVLVQLCVDVHESVSSRHSLRSRQISVETGAGLGAVSAEQTPAASQCL